MKRPYLTLFQGLVIAFNVFAAARPGNMPLARAVAIVGAVAVSALLAMRLVAESREK